MNKFLCNILAAGMMVLLTACGGISSSDIKSADIENAGTSASFASAAASPEVTSQTTEKFAKNSLQSVIAPPAVGSTIVIEPSRPGLSLDLFNSEVRLAVDQLDTDRAAPLQWIATFKSAPRAHAVVSIIGVGGGTQTASAALPTTSNDEALSPSEYKRAICLGAGTYSASEYYKAETAYNNATEAMAVGMAAGTPDDQVYARLDQLRQEEENMTPDQAGQRYEARLAIRDQRYKALQACVAG